MGNDDTKVQWPAKAVADGGDDLASPAVQLTDSLGLLKAPTVETPNTTAGVIDSTALQVTNEISKLIKLGGGAVAVVGALGSGFSSVSKHPTLAVTLAGGVAVVVAAMIIGLALVMNGDVRGRAAVTVEQLRSRGVVAAAFVTTASSHAGPAAGAAGAAGAVSSTDRLTADLQAALALGKPVQVTPKTGVPGVLHDLSWTADTRLRLTIATASAVTDVISLSEVASFTTATA